MICNFSNSRGMACQYAGPGSGERADPPCAGSFHQFYTPRLYVRQKTSMVLRIYKIGSAGAVRKNIYRQVHFYF